MSAAKMVADSTQSDTDSRKRRYRPSRREHRSRRDRRKRRSSRYSSSSRSRSRSSSRSRASSPESRSGSRSGSDEYDSDIDLQKELKPLKSYLRNPAQLLDQMLHSVRGSSLQRALPEALKDLPLEDLRKRCLEHLEVLSRKRMKRILAGDDPAIISSSCTEDDKSTDDDEKVPEDGAQTASVEGKQREEVETKDAAGARSSPLSLAEEELDYQDDLDNQHQPPSSLPARLHPGPWAHDSGDGGGRGGGVGGAERQGQDDDNQYDEGEEEEEVEEGEEEWEEGGAGEDVASALFPDVEQDRMELLELEMRARAIKAMLALHEQREREANKSKRK